jgi:hypothetical protein
MPDVICHSARRGLQTQFCPRLRLLGRHGDQADSGVGRQVTHEGQTEAVGTSKDALAKTLGVITKPAKEGDRVVLSPDGGSTVERNWLALPPSVGGVIRLVPVGGRPSGKPSEGRGFGRVSRCYSYNLLAY